MPAATEMTVVEIGEWYGLMPPLQMMSFEVTSVIGYEVGKNESAMYLEAW